MTSDLFVGARVIYEGNKIGVISADAWIGRTGVVSRIAEEKVSFEGYKYVFVNWDNGGTSSGREINFKSLSKIDVGDLEDDL